MLIECTGQWSNVRVESFEGLLVDYARSVGAQAVLRGIRAVSDYEYELQMAWMNRKLDSSLETVFMTPAGAYSYLSSRLVREIASLGGTLDRPDSRLGGEPAARPSRGCRAGSQISSACPADRLGAQFIHRNRKGIPVSSTVGATAFTARIGRIEISATMAINNDATTLRAQGVDLVDFGAGEPHFATPEHIKQAGIEAIQKNFTKYTRGRRNQGAARGHSRAPQAGLRLQLQLRRDHRHHRRQERAVQHLPGADRSRRRGHHPGAVLGLLQGHGGVLRRQVRLCRRPRPTRASA